VPYNTHPHHHKVYISVMDRIKPRPAPQHDLPLKSGKVELKQEMNSTPIRTRDLHNKENNNLHRNQNMQRRPTQEP
jgi:hypothetical protein